MTENACPIDAVITWVDGADPVHKAKLRRHLKAQTANQTPNVHPTRFSDDGEIEYCVQSILRFAPWVRTIYIVTDEQTPALLSKIHTLATDTTIKVVDHKDIFKGYESYLPTFNTRTIANMIWRIPDLSEQFLFFNDDYFLCTPMQPEDFFQNGQVILRGSWHFSLLKNLEEIISAKINHVRKRPCRPKHSTSQRLAARIAGYLVRYFMVRHNPHPFLKSTWKRFFEDEPRLAEKQLSHPLRSAQQYNVDALSAHLNIRNHKALIKHDIRSVIIQPERMTTEHILKKLKDCFEPNQKSFLCLQSLDNASESKRRGILAILNKHIGNPFQHGDHP